MICSGLNPKARLLISDPSWENHQALFDYAGYKVESYPYYDPATHGVKIDAMIGALKKLPAGSIAVLHACCHNPTGVDLSAEQWERAHNYAAADLEEVTAALEEAKASSTSSVPTPAPSAP